MYAAPFGDSHVEMVSVTLSDMSKATEFQYSARARLGLPYFRLKVNQQT